MTAPSDAEHVLADLVRIPSVTPWLIPDGEGEEAVAQYLAGRLERLPAVSVALEEVAPGRPNVVARLHGAAGGPRLWLNAHSDTVGYANWRDRALLPATSGDRLVGIGAADDKAGCAVALLALESLVARGVRLQGELVAAFTVDEEGVSIGTEDLLRHHQHEMDACLVLEPDGIDHVIVEHQGFGWIDIVVHGRAAHGSAPDVGIDAIQHMAPVIGRLGELDHGGFGHGQGGASGRIVFHTGAIRGGTDYATYPNRCVLGIEIGTQPGETLANRIDEIEQIFAEIKGRVPDFHGEVDVKLDREPFKAQGHERLWDALAAASDAVTHMVPAQLGMNAWADSGLTQAAGVPTLLYGPAGGNFHAPDEWASISEIAQAAEIVAETAERFCRQS